MFRRPVPVMTDRPSGRVRRGSLRRSVRCRPLAAAFVLAAGMLGLSGVSVSPSALAAPAPIKVGVICSCSGVVGSAFVDAVDGYLAWAKATNAAGGIAGHHIDV